MHPQNPPGAWHIVAPGETLADIAARTGVPEKDILEINGLERADEVMVGRHLYLLANPRPPAGTALPAPLAGGGGGTRLRWPLEEPALSSPFGTRRGKIHEGIDLRAPVGTPVYAADEGEVVYAGDAISGYGNLVVLQHAGDLLTVYAHNSALLVRQGERVPAGHKVALVGQSGRATGPHLHFEVREGQIPRDPMRFLPAIASSASAQR
jgi:murein DD-endopeptidase MepM/ murein hydrolase activator NlpD